MDTKKTIPVNFRNAKNSIYSFFVCLHKIEHVKNSWNRSFAPDSLWDHMHALDHVIYGLLSFLSMETCGNSQIVAYQTKCNLTGSTIVHLVPLCVSVSPSFNWAFVRFEEQHCYFFDAIWPIVFEALVYAHLLHFYTHKKFDFPRQIKFNWNSLKIYIAYKISIWLYLNAYSA